MTSQAKRSLTCSAGIVSFLALVWALPAFAIEWDLTLGAGVGVAPDYEGANEYNPIPILVARAGLGKQSVELWGTGLRATLLTAGMFSAGPIINYPRPRNDVDDDAVDDLGNIEAALEVGGFVWLFNRGVIAGLTATPDVAGGHDGYLITAELGYRARIHPLLVSTVIISSTYANGDFMDTYSGINAGDSVASGLDEFDADAGFKDVGVTLNLQHGRCEGGA
ncbi:MAG: MipA/OmpV family protein [Pseudomonadota bacterium]